MSHFARVKNGKVVGQQRGIEPVGDNWVHIDKKWELPTAYPFDFYSPTSNIPKLSIVGREVHETWDFVLKSVDFVKEIFYEEYRVARYALQIGSFVYNGQDILIGDRETSFIIASLPEEQTNYKLKNGSWLVLSASDVVAFKQAHHDHVQGAYDWEKSENDTVSAMTTLDELKALREL